MRDVHLHIPVWLMMVFYLINEKMSKQIMPLLHNVHLQYKRQPKWTVSHIVFGILIYSL